ncbi:MAG: hypothetical protein IH621_01945 [Krumholzibacteria bacterium]|nr:hypothetical protein [Candidatus Krumholzibacteria bacterium]
MRAGRRACRAGLAGIAIAFCALCARAGTEAAPPAWVDEPTAVYAPDVYIVGAGRGPSADLAAEAARADLAAGFRARIRSVSTVIDDVSESFGDAGDGFDRETRTRRATKVESDEVLANVVVGGTWFDPATGLHHALVYLDRREAEQTIGADLQACLTRINELLDCDGCYPDPLRDLGAASRARDGIREYERLCAQLRVVSNGRAGEVDGSLAPRAEQWLAAAKQRCTVRIRRAPPELAGDLRAALLTAGLTVIDAPARYEADLAYATSAAPPSAAFVFENWELELRIQDTADGAEIAALDRRDKAGHKTREAARQRCLREARGALEGELGAELGGILLER